jgi:hypothetical protein
LALKLAYRSSRSIGEAVVLETLPAFADNEAF